MSRVGYEQYGARCVASYAQFWPASVPLVVYGDEPLDVEPAELRLTSDIKVWRKQLKAWTLHPPKRPRGYWIKPQSYIWDVTRFAVKVFVWCDAAERMGAGTITWLDADTETIAPVPEGLTERLLHKKAVAYLGRAPGMHPETGYVGFRIPEALPLLQWMRKAYRSRWYLRWSDGWTDCHVLRAGLRAVNVPARDLTSHTRRHWRSTIDAMARSPLGPYVVHYKGRRHAPLEVVA
jgi:hypothetical protein